MTIELKQGLLLKSNDDEFVYNIYSYSPECETMVLDILNKQLSTIVTKNDYSVQSFKEQIEAGTIVNFKETDVIGKEYE